MFGNIILDMLEFKIPYYSETETLKKKIQAVLSKHFDNNAYKISGKTDMYIRFIPSRYYPDIIEKNDINDVNMETISLENFESLFEELDLPSEITEQTVIREVHLCKNLILEYSLNEYYEDIVNVQRRSTLKVRQHHNGGSIELFTTKRKMDIGDTVANKKYIMYDKMKKFRDVINNDVEEIFLKEVPNDYDKALLKDFYSEVNNSINIKANISRFEIKYIKGKVADVAYVFDSTDNTLYLSDFINSIKDKTLYSKLNSVYDYDIMENIFPNAKPSNNTKKLYSLVRKLRKKFNIFEFEKYCMFDKATKKKFRYLCSNTALEPTEKIKELCSKLLTFIN